MENLKEEVLPMNYPIHYEYIYVAVFEDSTEKPLRNTNLISGEIIHLLKDWNDPYYELPKVISIKNCDLVGRGLL